MSSVCYDATAVMPSNQLFSSSPRSCRQSLELVVNNGLVRLLFQQRCIHQHLSECPQVKTVIASIVRLPLVKSLIVFIAMIDRRRTTCSQSNDDFRTANLRPTRSPHYDIVENYNFDMSALPFVILLASSNEHGIVRLNEFDISFLLLFWIFFRVNT